MWVDDVQVQFDEPIYIEDGRLFAPVRHVVEYFQGEIQWDAQEQRALITTHYRDRLTFTVGDVQLVFNDKAYIMDVAPFIRDERLYIPLRHLAEFLHAEVAWDETTNKASMQQIPLYTLSEGETIIGMSEEVGVSLELLEERNQVPALELRTLEGIKFIIPGIMEQKLPAPISIDKNREKEKEPHPEFELLAKLIQVEAGYESYEGQLAVGSVVMNRVNNERFPNSITDVIYAKGQFPPAHNGLLDRSVPSDSAKRAAQAVLDGENNVEGALYFHNPNVSWNQFWASLDVVAIIGNHRFAK